MTVPALEKPDDEHQYDFGQFSLRPDGTLLRDAEVVPLPPKELVILRLLLAFAGQVVSAGRLRQSAWGDVHVSDDSLPRCVSSLRARLEPADCIHAVYKRGYRFNLAVQQSGNGDAPRDKPRSGRRVEGAQVLPRLVILPFSAGAGVPEQLGCEIAEEAMLRLSQARYPLAEILARDSVFALAVRGYTALEIGRALEADIAVTGAIVALPMHFRLRAEIIRVNDAVQLWIEDFLVSRNQLPDAQDAMARHIATRIHSTFMAGRGLRETLPEAWPQNGFLQK